MNFELVMIIFGSRYFQKKISVNLYQGFRYVANELK